MYVYTLYTYPLILRAAPLSFTPCTSAPGVDGVARMHFLGVIALLPTPDPAPLCSLESVARA